MYLVLCCCTNDAETLWLLCSVEGRHTTSPQSNLNTQTTVDIALLERPSQWTYILHVVRLYCICPMRWNEIVTMQTYILIMFALYWLIVSKFFSFTVSITIISQIAYKLHFLGRCCHWLIPLMSRVSSDNVIFLHTLIVSLLTYQLYWHTREMSENTSTRPFTTLFRLSTYRLFNLLI